MPRTLCYCGITGGMWKTSACLRRWSSTNRRRNPTREYIARSHSRRRWAQSTVEPGSSAALVLEAAEPWTADTQPLFPDAARERARALFVLGHRLSREMRFEASAGALFDLWMDRVVPYAMSREAGHEGEVAVVADLHAGGVEAEAEAEGGLTGGDEQM